MSKKTFIQQFLELINNKSRIAARLNERTFRAIANNPKVKLNNNQPGVIINNRFVPMITRNTRDFNQTLCSVGESDKREILLLEPQNPILDALYHALKNDIKQIDGTKQILTKVMYLTRLCFPETKPDLYIEARIKDGRSVIKLHEMILAQNGVCRHHALLNAYLLSRLVEDKILHGQVIHHRQNFENAAAHTWNLFCEENGKVYSLDSLWNNLTCITDSPGALDKLYKQKGIDQKIKDMHPSIIIPPQDKNYADKIDHIKRQIETQHFTIASYGFFKGGRKIILQNGCQKRLPHRVAAIYEAITLGSDSEKKLWEDIQFLANEAILNPRKGQRPDTTFFYELIQNDLKDVPPKNDETLYNNWIKL